jgi:hypothetical protein
MPEDTLRAISLTGWDPDGRALTFSLATEAAHGKVTLTSPIAYYRPDTNYFGADSFTFRANNGVNSSVPAQITIAVTQVPDVSTASLMIARTNNSLVLSLAGEPYDRYGIEASSDLVHWTLITNLIPTNGPLPFIDPEAAAHPVRFYRCALQLPVPQFSGFHFSSNGGFQFNFNADVGRYYQVLASTNLADWLVLTNAAAPGSNVLFIDPAAADYPQRFYLARPSP